jgi:hypothetical protein
MSLFHNITFLLYNFILSVTQYFQLLFIYHRQYMLASILAQWQLAWLLYDTHPCQPVSLLHTSRLETTKIILMAGIDEPFYNPIQKSFKDAFLTLDILKRKSYNRFRKALFFLLLSCVFFLLQSCIFHIQIQYVHTAILYIHIGNNCHMFSIHWVMNLKTCVHTV